MRWSGLEAHRLLALFLIHFKSQNKKLPEHKIGIKVNVENAGVEVNTTIKI